MAHQVDLWLDSGGEVREGLRLLGLYAPNPPLALMVERCPAAYGHLLKKALSRFSSQARRPDAVPSPGPFRKEWPFLAEPDCPAELKVLAADKITAYHNYVEAHARLASCTTLEECFACARKVLENYSANRKIFAELSWYREHHSVLGRHEIFRETRHLAELRRLPVAELFALRDNLKKSVWRIRREIAGNSRPDLGARREARLAAKERELNVINDMIGGYGGNRKHQGHFPEK